MLQKLGQGRAGSAQCGVQLPQLRLDRSGFSLFLFSRQLLVGLDCLQLSLRLGDFFLNLFDAFFQHFDRVSAAVIGGSGGSGGSLGLHNASGGEVDLYTNRCGAVSRGFSGSVCISGQAGGG